MLKRVRFLAGQSLIYGTGTILTQGIAFFLIPLYTQYLAPDAYGVLAVANAIISILVSVFSLGLPYAAIRFFFDTADSLQRKRIIGTIWLALVMATAGFSIALFAFGPLLSQWFFPDIPFFPYLFLALLITGFQVLRTFPLAFFRAQEDAKRFVIFSFGAFLLTVAFSILLVAAMRAGPTGALVARLIAYAIVAVAATVVLLRYAKLNFQPRLARSALAFGIPLVPSALFGWLLRLSDRVIMQLFVNLSDIGIYTLGYQLGESVSMLGSAINSAWSPFYYRTFQEHEERAPAILAPIITYIMMITIGLSLALAMLSPEIIEVMAQPDYHDAYLIVPWIAVSSVIQVFNWISRQGIMYAKSTYWDPVIYLLGGGVNLGLNIVLLPRVGYMAAAWTTLIGFGVMGVAMLVVSQRVRPMKYEIRRLVMLIIAAAVVYFLSQMPTFSSLGSTLVYKVLLLGLYPILLVLMGFLTPRERTTLHSLYIKSRRRLSSKRESA
jgi:O-antigen/teichoic acid export membrane protein